MAVLGGWRGEILVGLSLLSASCAGEVQDLTTSGRSPGAGPEPAGDFGSVDPDTCTESPSPAAMRLLTVHEYERTVADLVGQPVPLASLIPGDARRDIAKNEGFHTNVSIDMDRLRLDKYRQAAEQLAPIVAAQARELVSCGAMPDDVCLDLFVLEFGRRVFRRPLSEADVAGLKAIYASVGGGFAQGIEWVAAAMFQSVPFLYHVELGDPARDEGNYRPLSGYEVAARLSYLLWGTAPPPSLLDAAALGELDTEGGVQSWATRLLDDPRARAQVARIHEEWLWIDELERITKIPEVVEGAPASILTEMREETRAFVEDVVFRGSSTVEELLGSTRSFVGDALSSFYGVPPSMGDEVDWGSQPRAGVLTHGSWLARHAASDASSPTKRGSFVINELLCENLELPEDINIPPLPSGETFTTTRERFAAHADLPCATACHGLMDPVGYAFENFDALGRFRATENGAPVDASGQLSLEDVNVDFDNAVGLVQELATSDLAARCYGKHMHEYVVRRPHVPADLCAAAKAGQDLARGGTIRDLLVSIAGSRSFRFKNLCDDEAVP